MADTNELTPEEGDEQNQRLIQDLLRLYSSHAEVAQRTARVRQRLFQTGAEMSPDQGIARQAGSSTVQRKGPLTASGGGRVWQRRFSTLAAAVFAALLVGALLLVLNAAHLNRTGGAGNKLQQGGEITVLRMIDATTGWALTRTAVLRTTDGGMNWKDVTPSGSSLTPGSMGVSLSTSLAWVAEPQNNGATTRIFRTSDGGQSWQSIAILTSEGGMKVAQISFLNAQDGWILFNRGGVTTAEVVTIYRTSDGGKTWVSVSRALAASTDTPPPGHLPFGGAKTGIHFLNASTGWVTGTVLVPNLAWLYVSHDGGSTWKRQTLPVPSGLPPAQLSLRPPSFFSASEGILPVGFSDVATGAGLATTIYVTRDGGATWKSTTPVPTSLRAVDFLDMQHGWVTSGSTLFVTGDGGLHWTKRTPGAAFRDISELDFVSNTLGWAVSGQGLLKTMDGGQTWSAI